MIDATRNWFRRNRARFAVGLGLIGGTYFLVQYVLSKLAEARERMSSDRVARENLRRRFQQNQEDCTITVLALLPTAAENILEALPVESITHQLQQQRAEKLGRSVAQSEISPSEFSGGAKSVPDTDGKPPSEDGVKSQDEQLRPGSSPTDKLNAEQDQGESQGGSQGESQGEQSQSGESFIHTSQMAQSTFEDVPKTRKTKVQLWNELKVQSVTRTFTMVYTVALLTLFTRVQLNLLGRRSYLSSVVSLATPPTHESTISLENHDDDRGEGSYGNDFETNRKFLTFSWWLLHRGWKDVSVKVEAAVNEVFGPVNVREDLSLDRLSQLVVEVRKQVEGATAEERKSQKWLTYLLPPPEQEMYVLNESGVLSPLHSSSVALGTPASEHPPATSPSTYSISPTDPLRRLLDETSDLIDSPTASHITTLLLDSLFGHLTDIILRTQAFKLPPLPSASNPHSDPSFIDPNQRVIDITEQSRLALSSDFASARAKLATILAVVTRQAHAIGSGVPNEYVQSMESVRELEAFAAVVYSSNFEIEGLRAEEEGRNEENEPAASTSGQSGKSLLNRLISGWW